MGKPVGNDGSEIDLGRIFRLKGMVEAACLHGDLSWTDAPGLTQSFNRLRGQVINAFEGRPEREEVIAAFPEVKEVAPTRPNPTSIGVNTAAASEANGRLKQLAGWLGGFADEAALAERIQAEADERAEERWK